MKEASLGRDYFARVYAQSDDPWSFATSAYEQEKYAATIAALETSRVYPPRDSGWSGHEPDWVDSRNEAAGYARGPVRFASAFEIGCSIGVLTRMLASRCDALLAVDINERALDAARIRCDGLPNVSFELMTFPKRVPDAAFDLIVVSEVAYYWSDDDLAAAIDFVARAGTGCVLELVHFLPKVDDYVRDGDAVHAAFLDDPRFDHLHGERAERYRIDVLRVR